MPQYNHSTAFDGLYTPICKMGLYSAALRHYGWMPLLWPLANNDLAGVKFLGHADETYYHDHHDHHHPF